MAPPLSAVDSVSFTSMTPTAPVTRQIALRPGFSMEYDVYSPRPGTANGKSVVLLHGFPLDKDEWRKVAPQLAAQGYTVYAPNMRGFGNTSRPGFEKGNETVEQAVGDWFKDTFGGPLGIKADDRFKEYAMPKLTRDVKDFVDKLGLQKPDLVGHDWGAIVADAVASQYSDSFRKVARFNGAPAESYLDAGSRFWTWLTTRYTKIFETPVVGETLGSMADFAWMKTTLSLESPGTFTQSDFDRFMRDLAKPGVLSARMAYYKELRRSLDNGSVAPSGYKNPLLAVSSKNDIYVRPELMAPDRTKVPNAQVAVMDGSHWSTMERPNEVSRRLLAFLNAP